MLFIEVKILTGVVLKEQKQRHALLRRLDFEVELLFAATPRSAVDQAEAMLMTRLG